MGRLADTDDPEQYRLIVDFTATPASMAKLKDLMGDHLPALADAFKLDVQHVEIVNHLEISS